MIKLLKYEFRKTLSVKLVLIALTVIAQAVFMFGLYGNQNNSTVLGIVALTILAITGVVVMSLASILTLHQDMNTRQSYMLFMTPNSSYRILGAKVLENGISTMLAGACFFALGMLDVTLLFGHYQQLDSLWEMFSRYIRMINASIQIDVSSMLLLTFSALTGWFATVTAVYLADVISAALLNGKRFNGLVTFVFIIVIVSAMNNIVNLVTSGMTDYHVSMLVSGLVSLVLAGVMYFATAQLMERKLSV